MRIQILSDQEVSALLSYLLKCSHRDQLLFRLMLHCGLRIGEVSALDVEHVWRAGYVHPAINLVRGTTKGHKARFVDIPQSVRFLIETHMKHLVEDDPDLKPTTPLFLGHKRKQRLGVSGIGRIVNSISLLALGRRLHPHILRHTYATILMKYTNIRVVQTLLGHSKLGTTEIYTHVSSEDCKSAVNQAFSQ